MASFWFVLALLPLAAASEEGFLGLRSKIPDFAEYARALPTVSKTVTVYFSGANPACSNCGQPGQFACSSGIGAWSNGTKVFSDPGPGLAAGYVVTDVEIALYGSYSCRKSGSELVRVTLDGTLVDEYPLTGSKLCECNTCDGVRMFKSLLFAGGFPNYKYNGINDVQVIVAPDNDICLNRIEVNLTYSANVNLRYAYQTVIFGPTKSNCTICAGPGQYACVSDNQIGPTGTFMDPVPAGNIVTRVYGEVFGAFAWTDMHLITLTLDSTPVGLPASINGRGSSQCNDCFGGVYFDGTKVYQMGWPAYQYGGTNTVATFQDAGIHSWCVGFVELVIEYYPKN